MPETPDRPSPIVEDAGEPSLPPKIAQMAELGILTASLLHELRQPLFAIRAMCQLARGGSTDPEEALRRVDEHVAHIAELVEFYGGIGLSHDTEVFDLNEPVSQVVAMLDHRSRAAGVHVMVELHQAPLWVDGRVGGARQVITNLLHNALDAAREAGSPSVSVHTRPDGANVLLEVRDSGVGVPPALRMRMFEPFVSSKGEEGTGLGLYIARELVRDVRGDLTVESPPSGGTVFTARYPRVGRTD